jgi:hypothetical protein
MIINHRGTSEDRYKNLIAVIDYFKAFCDEIIVVEQDSSPKLNIDGIKHIFVKNDGLFNRSWGFNIGINNATNEKIIFNDNDIFIDLNHLRDSYILLDNYNAVNPYSKIIDLSMDISNAFITTKQLPKVNTGGRSGINFSGGMLLMNKSAILAIGGWDEDMRGWGGEDDLMTHKIFNLCTHEECNNTAYHLHHSRFITDTHQHDHYNINLLILSKIRSLNSDQLKEYYSNKIIGDINKYNL